MPPLADTMAAQVLGQHQQPVKAEHRVQKDPVRRVSTVQAHGLELPGHEQERDSRTWVPRSAGFRNEASQFSRFGVLMKPLRHFEVGGLGRVPWQSEQYTQNALDKRA